MLLEWKKIAEKVARQIAEAILHAIYEIGMKEKKNHVVLEFIFQMPTKSLRVVLRTSAFLKSLENHQQLDAIKELL